MKKSCLFLVAYIFVVTFVYGQLTDTIHPKDHVGLNAQMNDYCRTCHTCEYPTAGNPCLMQCARQGALFTSSYSFEDGPEIVVIERLQEFFEPVTFYHGLHASMMDIGDGCIICHHYSEKSGEIPSCNKCHKNKTDYANLNMPSLKGAYHRQCLGCHKEWSHKDDCQFCHKETKSLDASISTTDKTDIVGVPHPLISADEKYVYQTPYQKAPVVTFHHTDHVNLFGLKCTDCHKGDTCCRCHDVDKPKEKECQVDHVESCCKCHMERNCDFCHSDKEKPPFNHDKSTGFVLGHYHQDVDCNNCHSSVSNFITPSTNCTGCHIHWELGVFDHSVTGLVLNDDHIEEECEVCHLDRNFRAVPTCENCHDDITYPDELPGDSVQK